MKTKPCWPPTYGLFRPPTGCHAELAPLRRRLRAGQSGSQTPQCSSPAFPVPTRTLLAANSCSSFAARQASDVPAWHWPRHLRREGPMFSPRLRAAYRIGLLVLLLGLLELTAPPRA